MGVGGALPGRGRLNQFLLLSDRMQPGDFGRGRRTCAPPVLQGDTSNNDRTWGCRSAVTGGGQGEVRLLAAESGQRRGSSELADG